MLTYFTGKIQTLITISIKNNVFLSAGRIFVALSSQYDLNIVVRVVEFRISLI